ncbi:hypothetical protein NBRC110019_32300 [Neptunitalea chrysea]|uniref:Glycine zipper family protein n=1 Tax=Neptunitalea chrysea TaxID=1647581 RepID=A0A9W6B7H5_9FLAO|nr:hypothetical protein [Neptunitalea chrysea]GLB54189.1 hypothetical protein NBRC110019_32300 [Neptunitalea chrysea]
MTLQEASNFFKSLKNGTNKESEIKIYEKLLYIINALQSKELSKDEIKSIESELDRLNLESNTGNNKKYFNKILKQFKEYLKDKHSLIPAGYYTNIGISFGAAFGVVLGVVFGARFERSLGLALGVSLGMLIGLFIGRRMDLQAKAAGTVL